MALIEMSEVDLRRCKSALMDYRKAVKKMLPAETAIPKEVADLEARIDIALSHINEEQAREDRTGIR